MNEKEKQDFKLECFRTAQRMINPPSILGNSEEAASPQEQLKVILDMATVIYNWTEK
jgi:hypothetical protein